MFAKKIEKLDVKKEVSDVFVKKYSREKIMNRMADHIFSVL